MDSYSYRRNNLLENRGSYDNENRFKDVPSASDTSGSRMRKTMDTEEASSDISGHIRTPGRLAPSMRPKNAYTSGSCMSKTHSSFSKDSEIGSTSEHLASVHDNPFVREYGLDCVRNEARESSIEKHDSDVARENGEHEEEYGVNSGFVNKLRSKFAQLENKQSSNVVSLSKRASSLENLLSVEKRAHPNRAVRLGSGSRFSADDTKITKGKPRESELTRPLTRPDSKNSSARSAKPPVPRKQLSSTDYLTRRQKRNSTEPADKPKPHEDHHWKVAPDLEVVGRDDIVIIDFETKPKSEEKTEDKENEEKSDIRGKKFGIQSIKDKDKQENESELPKPHTVSNFRSLFEQVITQTPEPVGHRKASSSPTRTGSDNRSPKIISPSPHSPSLKKTSDSAFVFSSVTAKSSSETEAPKEKLSEEKENVLVSPRLQEKEPSPVSPREDSLSPTTSPRAQFGIPFSALEPEVVETGTAKEEYRKPQVSQFAEVFDSRSIVPERKERPKRIKPHGHPREKPRAPSSVDDDVFMKSPGKASPVSPSDEKKTIISPKPRERVTEVPKDSVSTEANIKPSARKAKVSPRGAQIFDSSKMIKESRPPPKVPKQRVISEAKPVMPSVSPEEEEKKSLPVKELKTPKAKAPPRPAYESSVSQNGNTDTSSKILQSNHSSSKTEAAKVKKPVPMSQGMPFLADAGETETETSSPAASSENDSTLRGRSSFLTNILKSNSAQDSNSIQQSGPETPRGQSAQMSNGSLPSPVPRKKQAPAPVKTAADNVEKSTTSEGFKPSEAEIPRSSIDDIINRKKKTVMSQPVCVFDSSKISNKRKEMPKRKPPKKTAAQLNQNGAMQPIVPILDFSSLNNESSDYQEGYIPTEIKPCPYVFLGAEVIPAKSPYKKTKKRTQVKISFDEAAVTTFEYEREELALENYLQEHPEEREEVEKEEQQIAQEVTSDPDPEPDTPRMLDSVALHKNVLDHSTGGDLVNYAPRMQVSFEFGQSSSEPEESHDFEEEHSTEPETDLQLRPADDSELDAFSAEASKSDLLF